MAKLAVMVYLDADSCARPAREVLERAQVRLGFSLVYVANRPISSILKDADLQNQVVEDADAWLLENVNLGSLAITRDIPLTGKLMAKGAFVMNDKGHVISLSELASRLEKRDWNQMLSGAGLEKDKRGNYSPQDKQSFASSLDKWLARNT